MGYTERKRILFFGLPWTFTKYTIEEESITINQGLLRTVENDCYMYRIQDTVLKVGFFERLFKLGTIECITGDSTHPVLKLEHIKNAKEIKNFISKASEEERRKKRTLNTVDIGANEAVEVEE